MRVEIGSPRSGLLHAAIVSALALAVAACADVGASGSNETSLSFAVRSSASAAVAADVANIVVQGTGGHTVDLQSADLVVDDIVFEQSGVDQGRHEADDDRNEADDEKDDIDDDASDNVEFRAGAATVALPLQGGVITPFSGTLPAGTYHRVTMKPQFVRLRGTVDGAPFDVTVPVRSKMRILIDPPLVVTDGSSPANVTVTFDVTKWLVDANGDVIDPRLLSTDETLREAFQRRVRASLNAFKDHDREGDRDDD